MRTLAKSIGACVLAALLVPGIGAAAEKQAQTDWPRWRGPNYDGISKERNWQTTWPSGGPKVLWKASVGRGFATVAVGGGRVFTLGNVKEIDTVYCFDAASGKELWKHPYPCASGPRRTEAGTTATPTIDGERVYSLSKWGHLFCFNVADGQVIWKLDLRKELKAEPPTWGFAGSPLVLDKLLILNVGSAGLALDKTTGKVVWQNGMGPPGYASPVPFTFGGQQLLAIFGQNALICLTADGKELWRFPWVTDYDVNAADPIVSGDKIFISSGYNKGAAVLKMGGAKIEVVWRNRKMRNHFNSCVLYEGHLYGFDESTLRCLEFDTGEEKWSLDEFGKGSLMIADGKLIVMGEKGELAVGDASPTGFKPISRAQVLSRKCWTVPVLAGGRIYCRNALGDLVCLDVSAK